MSNVYFYHTSHQPNPTTEPRLYHNISGTFSTPYRGVEAYDAFIAWRKMDVGIISSDTLAIIAFNLI